MPLKDAEGLLRHSAEIFFNVLWEKNNNSQQRAKARKSIETRINMFLVCRELENDILLEFGCARLKFMFAEHCVIIIDAYIRRSWME